jgi:hypothetical protein
MSTCYPEIGADAARPAEAAGCTNRTFPGYAQYAVLRLSLEPGTP